MSTVAATSFVSVALVELTTATRPGAGMTRGSSKVSSDMYAFGRSNAEYKGTEVSAGIAVPKNN